MRKADGSRVRMCPVADAAAVGPVVAAWSMLRSHNVLPVGGGSLDQTQAFLAAVAILDSEASASNG